MKKIAAGATRIDTFGDVCKKGFTLVEVLITLAIIGVIAAITLPTINKHIKQQQASSALPKMYAELRNAAKMYEADNGISIEDFDTSLSARDFLDTYFKPYFKGATPCDSTEECWKGGKIPRTLNKQYNLRISYGYKLANGTILAVFKTSAGQDGIPFFFDIDGIKGDNQSGHDIFNFYLFNKNARSRTNDSFRENILNNIKSDIYPGGNGALGSPLTIFSGGNIYLINTSWNGFKLYCPCSNVSISEQCRYLGDACAVALYRNNWKFPKGYPW